MTTQVWWYLARASGLVAWLMLTASVLGGVVLSSGAFPRARRPAWILDLHRWLGALTLGLVGLHVAALVADSYVDIDLVDVLVPMASAWRPLAVAFGVVATWLLVTVQATSLAMRRLPRRAWHAIHTLSYGTFLATTIHAVLAGTDRANPLFLLCGTVVVAAVAGATTYRVAAMRWPTGPQRRERRGGTPPARPSVSSPGPRAGAPAEADPARHSIEA